MSASSSKKPEGGDSAPPPKQGKFPKTQKRVTGKSGTDVNTPPEWARVLLAQVEGISSRVGLIEANNHKSYAVAAGGVPPAPQIEVPVKQASADKKADPEKPPKGQSGSGYTRIPNGKLVKNKRPTVKPLPLRQAKNWRTKSTTALVAFCKERGIGPDDPKPTGDTRYQQLVADLEKSKAFLAYVRSSDDPKEVSAWLAERPQVGPSKAGDVDPAGDGGPPLSPKVLTNLESLTPPNKGKAPKVPAASGSKPQFGPPQEENPEMEDESSEDEGSLADEAALPAGAGGKSPPVPTSVPTTERRLRSKA